MSERRVAAGGGPLDRTPLVPVSFNLEGGQEDDIVLLARQRGTTRSAIYRQAIAEYLGRQRVDRSAVAPPELRL